MPWGIVGGASTTNKQKIKTDVPNLISLRMISPWVLFDPRVLALTFPTVSIRLTGNTNTFFDSIKKVLVLVMMTSKDIINSWSVRWKN